uniref:OSIGBa0159F11.6 protein n=1 Tax=Oryza sativa TaxID=4530 RepID=Q01IQ8_ORYSA|nr:OSIGBa0159F11.6 [Oryza sativa]
MPQPTKHVAPQRHTLGIKKALVLVFYACDGSRPIGLCEYQLANVGRAIAGTKKRSLRKNKGGEGGGVGHDVLTTALTHPLMGRKAHAGVGDRAQQPLPRRGRGRGGIRVVR